MSLSELDNIKNYFVNQPVLKAWLFGSFARGEETRDSDVDILVVFDEGVGLFKYASIKSDLERELKRSVDLVSEGSLFAWVKDAVDKEKILIYERKTERSW